MPLAMWNDVLCMGKRLKAEELDAYGVVQASAPSELFDVALELAKSLKAKGKDEKTRETRLERHESTWIVYDVGIIWLFYIGGSSMAYGGHGLGRGHHARHQGQPLQGAAWHRA